MTDFVSILEDELKAKSNSSIALKQKAYMRDQFEYFGIKTTERREIQKPFLVKAFLPEKENLEQIVKELYSKPERDFHYFAQELTFKYIKQLTKQDIKLIEYLITTNSWWDTVDFIAVKLAGGYFKLFPEERNTIIQLWLDSNNIWLQRSALLFQLKYKDELDHTFLSHVINTLLGSKEFFINKAIGWVLREYSRKNPDWVLDFVSKHELSNLSKKEALRLLN